MLPVDKPGLFHQIITPELTGQVISPLLLHIIDAALLYTRLDLRQKEP